MSILKLWHQSGKSCVHNCSLRDKRSPLLPQLTIPLLDRTYVNLKAQLLNTYTPTCWNLNHSNNNIDISPIHYPIITTYQIIQPIPYHTPDTISSVCNPSQMNRHIHLSQQTYASISHLNFKLKSGNWACSYIQINNYVTPLTAFYLRWCMSQSREAREIHVFSVTDFFTYGSLRYWTMDVEAEISSFGSLIFLSKSLSSSLSLCYYLRGEMEGEGSQGNKEFGPLVLRYQSGKSCAQICSLRDKCSPLLFQLTMLMLETCM